MSLQPSATSIYEDFSSLRANKQVFLAVDVHNEVLEDESQCMAVGVVATESMRDWISLRYGQFAPEFIQRSVFKRKTEYLIGRLLCAGLLMQSKCPLPLIWVAFQDRAPVWPTGFAGSISHTNEIVMAAILPLSNGIQGSIGIDIEKQELDKQAIDSLRNCFSIHELHLLGAIPFGMSLGFSAKESLFKCLNPIAKVFFDFLDVEIIEIDFTRQRMSILLLRSLATFEKGSQFWVSFRRLSPTKSSVHWLTKLVLSRLHQCAEKGHGTWRQLK